jgi:hypothetical protein
LNFVEVGAELDGGAEVRGGLGVIAFEIERDSQVGAGIDIVRIESQDGVKLPRGVVALALSQELLGLPRMRIDLLLFGWGLGEGGSGGCNQKTEAAKRLPGYSWL